MSFDLGVWYPQKRLSDDEAGKLYVRLCESDTIPEDRLDDHDYCPWSCALDHSPSHVILSCVWSKAEYVHQFVHELGRKHGLAVYDPQSDRVSYPGGSTGEA